jgi:hypothetical protein
MGRLLAFHLRLAFRSDRNLDALYRDHLAKLSRAQDAGPPSGRTLGGLTHALDEFQRWRTEGTEVDARQRHAAIYAGRAIDRASLGQLAQLRNELSHDRGGQEPRAAAPRFLELAESWLGHLRAEEEGPRLFPALVRVDGLKQAVGGFSAQGVDDEGVTEELFVTQPLAPGSCWYMVPRSNPVRSHPLLVKAD